MKRKFTEKELEFARIVNRKIENTIDVYDPDGRHVATVPYPPELVLSLPDLARFSEGVEFWWHIDAFTVELALKNAKRDRRIVYENTGRRSYVEALRAQALSNERIETIVGPDRSAIERLRSARGLNG